MKICCQLSMIAFVPRSGESPSGFSPKMTVSQTWRVETLDELLLLMPAGSSLLQVIFASGQLWQLSFGLDQVQLVEATFAFLEP